MESPSSGMTKNRLSGYPCQGIYKRYYTSFNIVDKHKKNMYHIDVDGNGLTTNKPNNFPSQMTHQ